MKSSRNQLVRTAIKEADDQKKSKITTTRFPCRKTCHLISSDKTLKNLPNGKEIKKLDGGNWRTASIVYAARCKNTWWHLFWQYWRGIEKKIQQTQVLCQKQTR